MSNDAERDERAWDADKRDFVADRRDEIAELRDETAGARDEVADKRDRLADERESDLDDRERRLDAYAAKLGVAPPMSEEQRDRAAADRAAAATERAEARDERMNRTAERNTASAAREQATKRRQADTPTTGLALAFAEIARHLYESDNFDELVVRVVETAVATVSGCDMASITLRQEQGTLRTAASTHAAALAADLAQYEAGEGPCLDAIKDAVVHTPAFPDPRWPTLGSDLVQSGVQAVVSYRLAPIQPCSREALAEPLSGSLNAYASAPNTFNDEAQNIGLILAAHASVAMRAVRERKSLEGLTHQIHEALSSRDVISQAKGILMERHGLTPEDAFDTLRRSSQQLNVKLREVAQRLVSTREIDGPDRS